MSAAPSPDLTGTLLLAAPLMKDPNFSRSVLYLAAHSKKNGAFGYVLNSPMHKVVGDLLPDSKMRHLSTVPVFFGGPVARDKLSFCSLHWDPQEGRLQCKTHLAVDEAEHEISSGHDVRAFVGYSGWSEGQLERELKHHSWIVAEPQAHLIATPDPETLWSDILIELGPRYELMANMPERPEMN